MNCAERKDLILLYAFDQLDADEIAALTAHMRSGCPTCAGELAAARTIAGMTGLATGSVAPGAGVRDRVVAETQKTTNAPARTSVSAWRALAATALVAAGLTAVAILVPARQGIERMRTELQEAHFAASASAARAASAEGTLKTIGSPATRVIAMAPAGPQPDAAARIFWDESDASWHVFFTHLKTLTPGRTYQLWLITPDQKKVSAGTFDVGDRGEASLAVKIPPEIGALALAAVTEEPEGGVPQPTGAIQLVGKLGT